MTDVRIKNIRKDARVKDVKVKDTRINERRVNAKNRQILKEYNKTGGSKYE